MQSSVQVLWKTPQSALEIRLQPGIGIQFCSEDHDGNEVTRIGMIFSILSETSVEVYLMYDQILLTEVDNNITSHKVHSLNLKRILKKTGCRDCFQSIYKDTVDVSSIKDLCFFSYPCMLDHTNEYLENNFKVRGYICFHGDNVKKNKFCEISYFSFTKPEQLIERMIRSSSCSASEYMQICRDIAEVKKNLHAWLKSRSSTFEKKGTREFEFKSRDISLSGILRLIPRHLWSQLK
eukprot:487603-Hanusia_phi.AAC.1